MSAQPRDGHKRTSWLSARNNFEVVKHVTNNTETGGLAASVFVSECVTLNSKDVLCTDYTLKVLFKFRSLGRLNNRSPNCWKEL